MEQFQYLQQKVGTEEPNAPDFILNVWLVWKGGRHAYLLETGSFEDPALIRQTMQDFSQQYPEILGTVAEGTTVETYPRVLLYRKGAVTEADIQAVASGTQREVDTALVRVLQFGCLDPHFGNENLDRTTYRLVVKAREFPREDVLTFVCSEKVAPPDDAYLRRVAGPVKAALVSTFHDVHVQWEIVSSHSLSKLVQLFGKFARGQDNSVLEDSVRRNFLEVLSADDARGYENLLEFFEQEDLPKYRRDLTRFAPAVMALLIMRLNDTGDYINSDPNDEGPYLERIERTEEWMINWMPLK